MGSRLPEEEVPTVRVRLLTVGLPLMFSELLRGVFAGVPDIQLAENVRDVHQVASILQGGTVDVILLGASRSHLFDGTLKALELLKMCYEKARVVVLTERPDYVVTVALFRAGVRGIQCTNNLRFDLLCKCIHSVHQGQLWANNELQEYLVASLAHPKSTDVMDSQGKRLLTPREQQVLHLLAEGLSNQDMAKELKLSAHTVKNHLFRIYDKLGVSNRMEAVLYALTPRSLQPMIVTVPEKSTNTIQLIRAS